MLTRYIVTDKVLIKYVLAVPTQRLLLLQLFMQSKENIEQKNGCTCLTVTLVI